MKNGKTVEKMLVVTTRNHIIATVRASVDENVVLVFVKTVDAAIDKIVANGFSATIIDCEIDFPKDVKINDLVKLNYTACKSTILIGCKNVKKLAKNALNKTPKAACIWNIVKQDNLTNDLKDCLTERKHFTTKTQQEMFEDIYSGIKQAKEGWFIKNPQFMIF